MKKQTITQKMRYRESLIKYAKKHGVTKTAIKYNTNRQYIYRWLSRYDGDIRSLSNMSRLANQTRIVLGTSGQNLNCSVYFILSSDYRIQFACSCKCRQIAAVLL